MINSIGMHIQPIPAGTFIMGSACGEPDEMPLREITLSGGFAMSRTPVTNRQYELFRPEHKSLREGPKNTDAEDEACVFVSWQDAQDFCNWLSLREGRTYRLPTEAEWEYTCRAGTSTAYHTGDILPEGFGEHQRDGEDIQPCSLAVGRQPPNAFGLYDMHGLVEEWCMDWYGPYLQGKADDPAGPETGMFRVTRGGSVYADVYHLRSARRMAALPEARNGITGFRVVVSDTAPKHMEAPVRLERWRRNVSTDTVLPIRRDKAYFAEPLVYVLPSAPGEGPYYPHNHVPAICCLDNGDLLAAWFSTKNENGREMVILASRFRAAVRQWDTADLFFKVPGRNMSTVALLKKPGGRLYHFNGVGIGSTEENLLLIQRVSDDDGLTWSRPVPVDMRYTSHKPIIQPSFDWEGRILLPCDHYTKHGPDAGMGSALYRSDAACTHFEERTCYGRGAEHFLKNREMAGWIAGVHGAVVALRDGRLLALGRSRCILGLHVIDGRMPMSISKDNGILWRYQASPFPPIGFAQRHALIRLAEGPLLLFSFTDPTYRLPEGAEGMMLQDAAGNKMHGFGLFAALSFDEGDTWPVQRLITPGGEPREWDPGASKAPVIMDDLHGQPYGYLQAAQSADGIIHLLSSRLHYRMNFQWLMSPHDVRLADG